MPIHIPANKLAEFITAKTPERRERIVRQARQGGAGHPTYYPCFHKPAREFLIGGARDATSILQIIESLKGRTASKWYATDSRITAEALRALIRLAPALHRLRAVFVRPGSKAAQLHMPDADIAVQPNLIVHGERNGKPLVGALRFYLAKESPYHLGVRGAELVAVMEYLWLSQIATGARTPDTSLCLVAECMQQRITAAPTDYALHVAAVERGCREFVRLWHQIDEEAA